jgi:hypothetical protein
MMTAVLAALVVAPAFAQSPSPRIGSKAQSGHEAFGLGMPFSFPMHMTPAREAAIRECNATAAKTYHVRDSNWSILMYRACMTQHRQPE